MRICLYLFLMGFVLLQPLPGGEAETNRLRVLAVGDPPPFRQEISGGVRRQLMPAAGTIPPSKLHIEESEPVDLRLGRLSGWFPISFEKDKRIWLYADGSEQPWFGFSNPSARSATVVVWRDPHPATWGKPKAKVVPDDPSQFPSGTAIVINLLPTALIVRGGGGDELLAPGSTCLRKLPVEQGGVLQMAFRGSDEVWRQLPAHYLEPGSEWREWIVLYRADQAHSRRPVGRLTFREVIQSEP